MFEHKIKELHELARAADLDLTIEIKFHTRCSNAVVTPIEVEYAVPVISKVEEKPKKKAKKEVEPVLASAQKSIFEDLPVIEVEEIEEVQVVEKITDEEILVQLTNASKMLGGTTIPRGLLDKLGVKKANEIPQELRRSFLNSLKDAINTHGK